jgi:hypothetical protein
MSGFLLWGQGFGKLFRLAEPLVNQHFAFEPCWIDITVP